MTFQIQDQTGDCVVCAEPTQPDASAACYRCTGVFHLMLMQNVGGKDCGEVWLDEEVMALQFACQTCIAEVAGETPQAGAEPAPAARPRRAEPGASARDLVRRRRR